MDLLDELENMAIVAQNDLGDNFDEQVTRFQNLFNYSRTEAKSVLERHRGAISHKTVSDTHWQMVRDEKEAQGYDREAYEYAIGAGLFNRQNSPAGPQTVGDPKATYMVKLEGPLDSPQKVQTLGKMLELPAVREGSGATGDACFCLINGKIKATIAWALKGEAFVPTFFESIQQTRAFRTAVLLQLWASVTRHFHRTEWMMPVTYSCQNRISTQCGTLSMAI